MRSKHVTLLWLKLLFNLSTVTVAKTLFYKLLLHQWNQIIFGLFYNLTKLYCIIQENQICIVVVDDSLKNLGLKEGSLSVAALFFHFY